MTDLLQTTLPYEYRIGRGGNKPFSKAWDFLVTEVTAQKDQVFLWWPVFLALGIGFYFSLTSEPPVILGVAVLLILLAGCIAVYKRPSLRLGLFLIFLISLGFSAAQFRSMLANTPMLKKELGPVNVEATIDEIEHLEPGEGTRVLFKNLLIEDLAPEDTPVRVRLKLRKGEGLEIGQRVKFLANLMPLSPPVMPGAFDFQRHMYFMQVGAVGFIFKEPEILGQEQDSSFEGWSKTLRDDVNKRVTEVLAEPESATARALLTSDVAGISKEDIEAMRSSGLYHILSISGLHIGLFSGVIFFTVRLLLALIPGFALKYPIKKYAAIAAFAGAWFYMILAGAPIPTQRSLIMAGIVYLAIILDRSPFSLRLVAFAAFVVMLLSPESLVSVSFQMSFAAVVALIAFFEWLRPYWSALSRNNFWLKRIALYFLGAVLTTLIASTAIAPFTLYHFQQVQIYSLPANVIVVPLVSFIIMPGVILSLFLMPFGLDYWPLQMMGWGIREMLEIARWFAQAPHATIIVPAYPFTAFLCIVCAVLTIVLWKGRLKALAGIFLMIAAVSIFTARPPDILLSNGFKIAMFRDSEGYHISSRKTDKFTAESWEQILGLAPGTAERWPKEGGNKNFSCDPEGCRLTSKDVKISFLNNPLAFGPECRWADLIVSFKGLKNKHCATAIVKDRRDGYHDSGHAVWLDNGQMIIRTVGEERGERPWSNQ